MQIIINEINTFGRQQVPQFMYNTSILINDSTCKTLAAAYATAHM